LAALLHAALAGYALVWIEQVFHKDLVFRTCVFFNFLPRLYTTDILYFSFLRLSNCYSSCIFHPAVYSRIFLSCIFSDPFQSSVIAKMRSSLHYSIVSKTSLKIAPHIRHTRTYTCEIFGGNFFAQSDQYFSAFGPLCNRETTRGVISPS